MRSQLQHPYWTASREPPRPTGTKRPPGPGCQPHCGKVSCALSAAISERLLRLTLSPARHYAVINTTTTRLASGVFGDRVFTFC